MRVAFYKGFSSKSRIYDKLICLWTFSKYSHCELVFSSGISFSSSPRENGCRYKHIIYNEDQWDIFYISSSEMTEQYIKIFCDEQIGKKYDWTGIFFRMFLPFKLQDHNKWWCSEILAKIFGFKDPSSFSPKKFYKYLKKIDFKYVIGK